MAMVVICTLIACSVLFTHRQVRRFRLLPMIYIRTWERCQLQPKIIASVQFHTILIQNSTYESFRGTFSLSVEQGWSSGSSSRIELGFSPDSFLGLNSDGGNHTRVFVISYAHGRILSMGSYFICEFFTLKLSPGQPGWGVHQDSI